MGLIETLTRPKRWTAPEAPLILTEGELEPLGTLDGYAWWHVARIGDLRERREELSDLDILPNVVLPRWVDGPDGPARRYRTFEPNPPMTYQALANAQPKPRRVPTVRPADLLDVATHVGPTQAFMSSPGQPKARGPVAILARLESKGRKVALAADGQHLVVSAPDGKVLRDVLDVIDLAGPLLVAHLRGTPLDCTVSAHPTPMPATTIAVGGAPWCMGCGS